MAAILPAGMRAISTEIDPKSAAGGFILPNDRVDVILTRRNRTSGGDQRVSDTLLHNVRVLAIGQVIEIKKNENVANGKTATLELTPEQAESLALASSMGEISLVLRSLSDARVTGEGNGEGLNKNRRSSVTTLRYGAKAQAFGVK
jgi:pilus assembly protein CpaB